jgi:hypothetical protein
MKTELSEDLKLTIDFNAVLDSLSDEARAALVRSASFSDQFIRHVVEMLATGSTEDGWWFDNQTTNRMRIVLLDRMDEISRETIRTLIQQRDQEKLSKESASNWAWDLWHRWPDDRIGSRPDIAKANIATYPNDEQIDALLLKRGAV